MQWLFSRIGRVSHLGDKGDRLSARSVCFGGAIGTRGRLNLNPLKAGQQHLVEHCGNAAERCQLRHVHAVLETGDGGMRGAGGVGDLLLSEAELEASLAQVGGDRIGLTKLADARVFVAALRYARLRRWARRCRRRPFVKLAKTIA
jgi:hypothetical protein